MQVGWGMEGASDVALKLSSRRLRLSFNYAGLGFPFGTDGYFFGLGFGGLRGPIGCINFTLDVEFPLQLGFVVLPRGKEFGFCS